MELEDNFTLTYEDGDANGIVTVGNATTLIKKKWAHSNLLSFKSSKIRKP
jgi:hypothetical protein